ncbi:hypothetical protein B0H39_003458 [Clostridium beijerinckii]|nr:hypothetical protein [Clostridium beijerinckii]
MKSFIIIFKANEAKEEILKKIDGALKKVEERENYEVR